MNCGIPADAVKLIEELKPLVKDATAKIALGVPATALAAAVEATAYTNIKIAAQNCHFEEKGAFTGEISPLWLAKMGVTYCIIGHSERREYNAETDETVNKKALALLKYGVKPIICCGESLAQREAGETFDWIKGQIVAAFKDIPADKLCQIKLQTSRLKKFASSSAASSQSSTARSAQRLSRSSTADPATQAMLQASLLRLTSTAVSSAVLP